jgi:hypothetical protein
MSLPSAETLLRVWEEHHGAHPIRRALALLDAAWPDVGAAAWAVATIGERDACLLLLYERLFGADLQTVAHCPRCNERIESSFSAADIRAQPPALPAPCAPLHLREHGYAIEFRLPNSDDLLSLAERGADVAASDLLSRCIGDARRNGRRVDARKLPAELVDRISREMAQHDPNAEVRIALACPSCKHTWSMAFDIVSYCWGELEDWAQRLLADVHLLAATYHWGEREILGLSPTRRRLYLDMVQA